MDNQHKYIKGYRDLTTEEVSQMNKVKILGQEIEKVVDDVKALTETDQRWASIAQTDLQKGIMALVRSIAKPTSF